MAYKSTCFVINSMHKQIADCIENYDALVMEFSKIKILLRGFDTIYFLFLSNTRAT